MAAPKMTKNQMRRAKKKEQKKAQAETTTTTPADSADEKPQDAPEAETSAADLAVKDGPSASDMDGPDGFDIDVVVETSDPAFAEFEDIMKRFGRVAEDEEAPKEEAVFFDQDDDIPSEDEETGQPKLSKKKRKQLNKLSVAELKALVKIPEIVEWQDVSSSDPRLLVQIKAQRNVVPVPPHWSLKREYLSSKRGIEKAPFRLPKFIAETGITEMRDAVLEKQEQQSLKQKQRERVAPKMGKLDIDYQRLYDAFFRFQTKPELTRFGEVYYEGKETEVIPERQQRTEGFFGSDRVYDLQQQHGGVPVLGQDDDSGRKRKKPGDIDVALDPDSLQSHDGISKDELRRRFEEGKKEDGIGAKWAYEEDLSEMIAQESRKRQKVDEKRTDKKKESKYRF
ncbi:hypothetical protein VdG1_05447 [Verticillium dahliae VDG1]|nr:hypothetical protein VdG1_05447 [Verticillium dahliae VDG1]